VRKVQAGLLTFAVIAATTGGFLALRQAFGERGRIVGEPAALPSNGLIVFERWENEQRSHLYTMRPDGSDVGQLTDFATSDGEPAVSPDGRIVAFVHELENLSPVIGSIPIAGGVVTWLTDEDLFVTGGPSWSPDGSRIAFAAHDGDAQRLFVMNANGTDQRRVTGAAVHWVESPAWSPDGAFIAFTASPLSGDDDPSIWDVYTIRPDGTGLRNVTNSPAHDEGAVTWSPDGERIAFSLATGRGSAIVVRRLSDSTQTSITDGSDVDSSPAWSPDGTLIAFDRAPASGGGFDVWIVRPDGSDPTRLTRDGGFSAAWQSIPAAPSASPDPGPSLGPEPEGRDIGLGFPLCHLERMDGIDWYGDGTSGSAWTGARLTDDGRCPAEGDGGYVVAADLDGDGTAEPGGMGFLEHCLLCRPFAATDLSGDGVLELVVLEEASSTPSYSIYEVSVPTSERSPGIYALFVAPPGAPQANLPANEPIRFSVGGDEGFSGGLRCEDYPDSPVLVYTWIYGEVDADTDLEVHEVRLRLGEDGVFHALDSKDFTIGRDEPTNISTSPACGVDFHPAP
jgi:Tol biopolymer transport system component